MPKWVIVPIYAPRMARIGWIIVVLWCASARASEPTWVLLQNDHFQVYSSASERATRQLLAQLERVRGYFFFQASKAAVASDHPVTVLMFGTAQEYQPYRATNGGAAYYTKRDDRDLIVVGEIGEQGSEIAAHEFTHLVFEHAGFKLPLWLNEGIADLYSTLRASGDTTLFGETLPGRLYGFSRNPWVPLQTILAVDHRSPYYREASRAEIFYGESWALVHMLMTTDQYRHKFWQVVESVSNGTPSAQALESVYGMSLEQLDSALRWYVSGDHFYRLTLSVPLPPAEQRAARLADMFDVRMLQAELLLGFSSRHDVARQRLIELTREAPTRPGPWADLGYLALGEGHLDEAAEKLGRAYDLGDRNPRLIMDLAHAFQGAKPARSMEALRALLAERPDDLDARLYLAQLQLDTDHVNEAIATMRPVATVKTAEQRDQLLYLRAMAALKLGDKAVARSNAEQLRQVTTSEEYKAGAETVIKASTPQ